jgi:hypothetical protein
VEQLLEDPPATVPCREFGCDALAAEFCGSGEEFAQLRRGIERIGAVLGDMSLEHSSITVSGLTTPHVPAGVPLRVSFNATDVRDSRGLQMPSPSASRAALSKLVAEVIGPDGRPLATASKRKKAPKKWWRPADSSETRWTSRVRVMPTAVGEHKLVVREVGGDCKRLVLGRFAVGEVAKLDPRTAANATIGDSGDSVTINANGLVMADTAYSATSGTRWWRFTVARAGSYCWAGLASKSAQTGAITGTWRIPGHPEIDTPCAFSSPKLSPVASPPPSPMKVLSDRRSTALRFTTGDRVELGLDPAVGSLLLFVNNEKKGAAFEGMLAGMLLFPAFGNVGGVAEFTDIAFDVQPPSQDIITIEAGLPSRSKTTPLPQ